MNSLHTLDSVSPDISGYNVIPYWEFQQLAGRSGMRAWDRLRELRDHQGLVEISLAKLSVLEGFEPVSKDNIRVGVNRLRQIGIVEDLGNSKKKVLCALAVNNTSGETMALLPDPVYEQKDKVNKWGRPKNSGKNSGKDEKEYTEIKSGAENYRTKKNTRCITDDKKNTRENNQFEGSGSEQVKSIEKKNPEELQALEKSKSGNASFNSRVRAARTCDIYIVSPLNNPPLRGDVKEKHAEGTPSAYFSSPTGISKAGGSGPEKVVENPELFLPVEDDDSEFFPTMPEDVAGGLTDLFARVGRGSQVAGDKFWKHPGVPRRPSLAELSCPVVPPPQALEPHWSEEQWFRELARLWWNAVEAEYGRKYKLRSKPHFGVLRGMKHPARSKYFKLVISAARSFVDHQIAPAAWFGFSFDVWHNYLGNPKDKPPTIGWVLGEKRLEDSKTRRWFWQETKYFHSRRLLQTRVHKELMLRYSRMQSALSQLPLDSTDPDIVNVVDAHFPDDLYDELKEQSRAQGQKWQGAINQCLLQGEWLWSGNWTIPDRVRP
jgi:hypothetical protein